MNTDFLYLCGVIAGMSPFLAIAVILLHYIWRRTTWKIKRRGNKCSGFCPSASALGMALLFVQIFVRPSLQNLIEQRQEENAGDDPQEDPLKRDKHFSRQLKRIRRGEPVDDLIVRL